MSADIPALEGLLSPADVRATAASIARVQQSDGALPWSEGTQTDVWNHVEAAMGLVLGGELKAARRAYEWCLATQHDDGSWPMRVTAGGGDAPSAETTMGAYRAVGGGHHGLVGRAEHCVRRCWPAVRRGLDFVVSMQLP